MLSIITTVYFHSKGALDSQPQVIKFTSCLPMVGGSLRVLRLLPRLKLVAIDIAEILLKVALNTINKPINQFITTLRITLIMTRRRSKTKSVVYTRVGV
jgi:hypothetical protein